MRLPTSFHSLCAALLLAGAATAAAAAPRPTSPVAAVAPAAAHPTFTVRVVGQGRPMLLIPGLACPGAVWDETVAHYQRQYQCHVVSLAGFGGAAPAAASPELLRQVRDELLAYVKSEKLDRPVVVGHSLGGFLGLWLSTTQPEAIGPLVILDSLPFLAAIQNPDMTVAMARPIADNMRRQMQGPLTPAAARRMTATMTTDTARISQATRWSLASDPATVGQAMYDLYTTDLRADLARIQQPALVLGTWIAYQPYGASLESTRAIFERQYALLPHHQIALSAAGKHFVMWDDTQWFLSQADAFLKENTVAKK